MCDEQQRDFRASFLPNVTLILLISQPPCDLVQRKQTLDPQEGKFLSINMSWLDFPERPAWLAAKVMLSQANLKGFSFEIFPARDFPWKYFRPGISL